LVKRCPAVQIQSNSGRYGGRVVSPGIRREPAARAPFNSVAEDPQELPLLDASTAALDEDHQHDHKEGAGDKSNNGRIVHFDLPFLSTLGFHLPNASAENESARRRGGADLIPRGVLNWRLGWSKFSSRRRNYATQPT
jgi:hypothetical protein